MWRPPEATGIVEPVRWVVVVGCSVLACTMPNPAFDSRAEGEAGDDSPPSGDAATSDAPGATSETISSSTSRGEDGESTSRAASSSEDDGVSESSTTGTVVRTCALEPSPGLSLAFGDPSTFGNSCPAGVDVLARIGPLAAGETTLATCLEGCTECGGAHPISALPLSIADYLPAEADQCVRLEATAPLGHDGEVCYWGALTIYDPATGAPRVIATAQSNPPTPSGSEALGGAIPEPTKGVTCDCETLEEVDACCARAADPPGFWAYGIDGQELFAGESATIEIESGQALFSIFQAESIPTCAGHALQTSWAVLAEP
jgi:hypothetical protein